VFTEDSFVYCFFQENQEKTSTHKVFFKARQQLEANSFQGLTKRRDLTALFGRKPQGVILQASSNNKQQEPSKDPLPEYLINLRKKLNDTI
jgi:hypothetical protein